jgi:mannose-6-phosphate isomerase-like protein (cupin superfamily)
VPDYDEIEWLARTDDVQVRINTLTPNEGTPWHFHTVVTDNVFALEVGLEVRLRDPDERIQLAPGQRAEISPRRVHRVVNATSRRLPYLLVQATGPYDFHEVK